tara:strand:+ start:272 stop:457 length:186 start_codon:yes stop_codon:yes gene_type:complete
MKLSVTQKCILSFIVGILVCCIYKHYKNNSVNGMENILEEEDLPYLLLDREIYPQLGKDFP